MFKKTLNIQFKSFGLVFFLNTFLSPFKEFLLFHKMLSEKLLKEFVVGLTPLLILYRTADLFKKSEMP
jgi:hypothetical protein